LKAVVFLLVFVPAAATPMSAQVASLKNVEAPSQLSQTPSSPSGLQIPVVPQDARQDAYEFASDLVEGMDTYIDAEETLSAAANKPVQSLTELVDLLAALRTTQSAWRLAQSLIARFKSSGDSVVAQTAAPLATSYGAMAEVYAKKVTLEEAMVKNPSTNMGDVAIEMSKLQSQSDQVARLMATATVAAAYALIDLSREDAQGHAAYLKLSGAEKSEVASRLKKLAGPSPENTRLDDSRSVVRLPALALWRWSGDWRGADEK
jgi:hypothetical protein